MSGEVRYAVYFAPEPGSALWQFGSRVIGYDAATGEDQSFLVPEGWTDRDWRDATAEPRRYGFHATLKAPFRLAEGATEAGLAEAFAAFAAGRPAPSPVPLRVELLDTFVALVPAAPSPGIAALEEAVLRAFEPFRAPLSPAERARRRPETLTARQRHALDIWGYPHVLEDFRFHMTLSGRLPSTRAPETRDALARLAAGQTLSGTIPIDRLGLFRQGAGEERFRIVASAPLGG